MNEAYNLALKFKRSYPSTVTWRLKSHCKVLDKHINPDEKLIYIFTGQKNDNPLDIITSCVIGLTDKRILIAQKRVIFGYFLYSITPDLFNDLQIRSGIIWGKVVIDTIKEEVIISNVSKRALDEIETKISTYMMEIKQQYTAYLESRKGNSSL